MKKSIKFFSIIMSVLMLLSVIQIFAFAANTGYGTMTSDYYSRQFSFDASDGTVFSKRSFNASSSGSGPYYYNQLTVAQKDVFNGYMAQAITATSFSVTLTNPIVITATSIPAYNDTAWNPVKDAVLGGFYAVIYDEPLRFWYDGVSYSWGYSYSKSGSTYTISVTSVNIDITFHASYQASTIAATYSNLLSAVNAFTPKGASRYEILRSIHDYIINLATYDPNYNNSNAAPYGHQPTGCLLSPYLCVCEGYAEAFKIFADRAGIPCALVASSDHIWDVVQMEDGKWYAIDCTWDDPMTGSTTNNYLGYSYFLSGSQTIPQGGSETYAVSHPEEIHYTSTTGVALQNPTLSTTAYSTVYPVSTYKTDGTQTNDHPGGSILKTKMLAFIVPGKTVANSLTCDTTLGSVAYTGNATGKTLTYTPKSGTAEVYTIIMRGDIDKDADCDSADLTLSQSVAVGSTTYSSGSAQTYAGDLNGDGVIDGFDTALMDRYQNGSYSFY